MVLYIAYRLVAYPTLLINLMPSILCDSVPNFISNPPPANYVACMLSTFGATGSRPCKEIKVHNNIKKQLIDPTPYSRSTESATGRKTNADDLTNVIRFFRVISNVM